MLDTEVKVKQGFLKGEVKSSPHGAYVSFKGIPYAKPPLGQLRFAAPQPPEPWEGIRDALDHGNMCLQKEFGFDMISGSEDCLYLNVYKPNPTGINKKKLPVMIFIHGGAFISGSGDSGLYGPEYFMKHNVLLVTINYRVEVLGFLSLDTEDVPGNAGLKDQVAAMKWVKENISNFGGDPNNITIFGESAGSVCVTYHLLSPLTKNLFHAAIAQSGVCTSAWASDSGNVSRAFRLGRLLGMDTNDPKLLINFLRKVPAADLAHVTLKTRTDEEIRKNISFTFLPVIEKINIPGSTFINKSANELLSSGRIHDVPLILGNTDGEGMLFFNEVKTLKDNINKDFKSYVEGLARLTFTKDIANKIRYFYFKDQPFTEDTTVNMVNLRTDFLFAHAINNFAKKYANVAKSPVYFYEFSCHSELNVLENLFDAHNVKLVCHGDDLFYMFKSFLTDDKVSQSSKTWKMIERMVLLWTNYAKYKNPTPQVDDVLKIKWEPVKAEKFPYLRLSDELKMHVDPNKDRVDFLNSLYVHNGFASKL